MKEKPVVSFSLKDIMHLGIMAYWLSGMCLMTGLIILLVSHPNVPFLKYFANPWVFVTFSAWMALSLAIVPISYLFNFKEPQICKYARLQLCIILGLFLLFNCFALIVSTRADSYVASHVNTAHFVSKSKSSNGMENYTFRLTDNTDMILRTSHKSDINSFLKQKHSLIVANKSNSETASPIHRRLPFTGFFEELFGNSK